MSFWLCIINYNYISNMISSSGSQTRNCAASRLLHSVPACVQNGLTLCSMCWLWLSANNYHQYLTCTSPVTGAVVTLAHIYVLVKVDMRSTRDNGQLNCSAQTEINLRNRANADSDHTESVHVYSYAASPQDAHAN